MDEDEHSKLKHLKIQHMSANLTKHVLHCPVGWVSSDNHPKTDVKHTTSINQTRRPNHNPSDDHDIW